MSVLSAFTLVHVLISLAGILFGLIVAAGLLTGKPLGSANTIFLVTTVLTSVTGFFFPFHKFLPSYSVGIISMVALAFALFALYREHLAGAWRRVYVVSAMVGLYLNVFVLIAQLFGKVAVLHALAPTQSEPPFWIAQSLNLLVFVLLTIFAVKNFHSGQRAIAAHS